MMFLYHILLLLSVNLAPVSAWDVGQLVKTTSGPVLGHKSPRYKDVSEYLGIRYAMAPVDSLRFMPPKRFSGDKLIHADSFSPDCPSKATVAPYTQIASKPAAIIMAQGQVNHTMSEDCLTLNIWTKPQSGEKKKAVMVWIHGGGFTIGASSSPAYDGATLADEQDVIIVGINYRLNIFGFPTAPGMVHQNAGLLDQRMAVEWVRDNIEAFGGDPSRITLFGESAGGISVDLYTYAWTKDPIINGFIAMSGTALLRVASVTPGNFSAWYGVSKKLGCGGEEKGKDTLACMQKQKFEDILASFKGQTDFSSPNPFGVYPDNQTAWHDYFELGRKGQFIKRPLFVGHCDLESGLFRFLSERVANVNEARLAALDQGYACPPGASASYRITHGVKAWRYRYFGVFDNQALSNRSGAYHSSEIPLIFGTSADTGPDSVDEVKLARNMRHAFAEFAKDPDHGLTKLGYPDYQQESKSLVKLGFKNNPEATFEFNRVYDKDCPSYVTEALKTL